MRVNLFVGKYFFPTEPNPNWLLILYFFLNPLTPCTNIVSLTTKMFHRCFDFYDDHAAVKLLFLYWHPDTGLILYMWWVFTLNLIFFFFFLNQCILFVMNVRVLVVDHCHWILSAAAAAVAVRSAGGGVERCSYPTVWFFFLLFLFNQLITSAPRTCWEITFLHLLLYLL